MKLGEIRYHKGRWMKYNNKFFPNYEQEHCVVFHEKDKALGFLNFESAHIYSELIKLKTLFKKGVLKA